MSFLTFHRPNFCCACGAKIIRLRWYPWTNRKFCNACDKQFRKEQFLQPLLILIALLLLGVVLGRATHSRQPTLVIQRVAGPTTAASSQASTPMLVAEDVYICGAKTKKGTPCSRRVHGPVRCWQHKGLPAMLPMEKLKIKE